MKYRLLFVLHSVMSKGRHITVNIFDMAGHSVFYEVHFFLNLM